jgi:hypothetical protein
VYPETSTEDYPVTAKDHVAAAPVKENTQGAACATAGSYELVVYCTGCKEEVSRTKISVPATGHSMKHYPAKASTCIRTGNKEYWYCSACNKYYSDAAGTKATSLSAVTVALKSHSYGNIKTTAATTTKNGSIVKTCSYCKKTQTTVIYYPKTVKLAKTSVTYSGKAQKPAVTVKDSKGNTISSKYYTLSYKNNKNVGTATVTVTFKGQYKGTRTLSFNIVPKNTSALAVTAKSKAMKVSWKKQASQTTGYQIQYAVNSKFTSAKTVTVKNVKTTTTTVSKLKGNTRYYVRIRTYQTVKVNGKSKKLYSAWSSVKSVKTKK